MLLQDKVAIVTGAATGIGEGIAQLFLSEGAHVFMLDCDAARNEEAARALPGNATAIACDVRDSKQIENAVESVLQRFGRIDILINNAGIYPRQEFLGMTEEQWDEMQDINLKSIFHFCRAVLPHMTERGSGKVVNISSVTFHVGSENLSHYVASKGGVIGFTRSVAREMGNYGVFVNCITPGAILVEAEKKVATWGYDKDSTAKYTELVKKGDDLIKSRQYDEAAKTWEEIAKLRPVDALPHQRLAG